MSSKTLPTLGLRGLICWVHCTPAHSRLQAQEPHWGKCPPPGSLASHPLEWAFGAITAGGWPKHSRALTISLLTFPCPRPDRKKTSSLFQHLLPGGRQGGCHHLPLFLSERLPDAFSVIENWQSPDPSVSFATIARMRLRRVIQDPFRRASVPRKTG